MKTKNPESQRLERLEPRKSGPEPGKRRRGRADRWAPSFAAAAGALGVSWDLVKSASAGGCAAFSNGRVNLSVLEEWIGEHAAELDAQQGGDSLRSQKLREEIRKLKIQNDAKAGKLVARSEVSETHARIFGKLRGEIERKLIHEVPMVVQGLDVATIRMKMKPLVDEMFAAFADCGEEWKA